MSIEELDQPKNRYEGIKIASFQPYEIRGIGEKRLKRLVAFEERVTKDGYEGGLLSWLVAQNKSLLELAKETELSRPLLRKVFNHFDLPRADISAIKREALCRLKQDPEFRAKQAAASSKVLRDLRKIPEYIEKLANIHSERFKRLHKDPDFEAKRIQAIREAQSRPEVKAKRSETSKKAWEGNEERRIRYSAMSRQMLIDRLKLLGNLGIILKQGTIGLSFIEKLELIQIM